MAFVTARYRPDNKSFGEFMMSESVAEVPAAVAKDIAETARGLAPKDGGSYAGLFSTQRTVEVLRGNSRRAAIVKNTAPYASGIEFGEFPAPKARPQGGGRGKPQHVLARAGFAHGAVVNATDR